MRFSYQAGTCRQASRSTSVFVHVFLFFHPMPTFRDCIRTQVCMQICNRTQRRRESTQTVSQDKITDSPSPNSSSFSPAISLPSLTRARATKPAFFLFINIFFFKSSFVLKLRSGSRFVFKHRRDRRFHLPSPPYNLHPCPCRLSTNASEE